MRKRSIALVIPEPAGTRTDPADHVGEEGRSGNLREGAARRWLLVLRPEDDEDLPGVWGLPAGTQHPGETDRELVRRIGREKLALQVEPGVSIAAGSAVRPAYRLDMSLWTAEIVAGEPRVEGTDAPGATTRYAAWRWADPSALETGARQGSLCCRLGIDMASRP
jgi:ADP-ribose pyrophosphatase YjhB (NUDIX family)